MSNRPPKPECSKWGLWIGKEIEGESGLGRSTLFVRRLPPEVTGSPDPLESILELTNLGFQRVWFCKEFQKWHVIDRIVPKFPPGDVCIECLPNTWVSIPKRLRDTCRIYMKVDVQMKEGDHVCVGPAFSDQAFLIGAGRKVTPDLYGQDICILK